MRFQKATGADPTASIGPTLAKKKPRTPAPPRPVQAPQRRDGKKRGGPVTAADQRARWLLYGLAALGPIALVVVLVVLFTGGNGHSSKKSPGGNAPKIDYAALAGLQKGKAPWPPEYGSLPDRLRPLGLDQLSAEVLTYHVHQHLDIFVNGKKETVPAFIGIDDGDFITELHTHDASGIIHVEAGKVFPYTLGQFFGVWGVRLSPTCIGGYCAKPGAPLKFYLNGKPYTSNPNNLILKNHEEIAIVYGKPPKKIPSTYDFAGYGV
jgi:hypothetical protein